MSTTFEISIGSVDDLLVCDMFRETDIFESFADYAERNMLNFYRLHPEMTRIHCILSGFPFSNVNDEEMGNLIRQASHALNFDYFDNPVYAPTEDEIESAFNQIEEHIAGVLLTRSVAAPSLTFTRNRLAVANAHWTRQLSILISTLLYDAGQLREKKLALSDKIERISLTIRMADEIARLETSEQIDELFSALVELDAKYAIRELNFIRREVTALQAIRSSESIDFGAIHKFVLGLLAFRDQNSEVVDGGELWTREVYIKRTFKAVDRLAHSNLWKPIPVKKPVVSGVKRGRKAKPAEQMTPEQLAKRKARESKQHLASVFGDMFGDKKNG